MEQIAFRAAGKHFEGMNFNGGGSPGQAVGLRPLQSLRGLRPEALNTKCAEKHRQDRERGATQRPTARSSIVRVLRRRGFSIMNGF